MLVGETFPGELLPCGLRVVHIQVLKCATYTPTCSVRPDISHAAAIVWDRRRRTALPPLLPVDCNTGESVGNVAGAKFVPPEIILRLA